jgi:hypothetical protein
MRQIHTAWLILGIAVLSGCASGRVQRQLEDKLAHEAKVTSRQELSDQFGQLLNKMQGISPEQREHLMRLKESVWTQSNQIQERSIQIRSLLVKRIMSASYDQVEVRILKIKLKEAEHQRIQLLFDAVSRVNVILGHWQSRKDRAGEEFYNQMLLEMMDPYYL